MGSTNLISVPCSCSVAFCVLASSAAVVTLSPNMPLRILLLNVMISSEWLNAECQPVYFFSFHSFILPITPIHPIGFTLANNHKYDP